MSAQLLPLAELAEALVLFKRAAQQAEQHGTLTKMNAAALESLSDAAGNLLAHGRSARGTITQILRGLRPKPPWAAMYLNDSTRNALLQFMLVGLRDAMGVIGRPAIGGQPAGGWARVWVVTCCSDLHGVLIDLLSEVADVNINSALLAFGLTMDPAATPLPGDAAKLVAAGQHAVQALLRGGALQSYAVLLHQAFTAGLPAGDSQHLHFICSWAVESCLLVEVLMSSVSATPASGLGAGGDASQRVAARLRRLFIKTLASTQLLEHVSRLLPLLAERLAANGRRLQGKVKGAAAAAGRSVRGGAAAPMSSATDSGEVHGANLTKLCHATTSLERILGELLKRLVHDADELRSADVQAIVSGPCMQAYAGARLVQGLDASDHAGTYGMPAMHVPLPVGGQWTTSFVIVPRSPLLLMGSPVFSLAVLGGLPPWRAWPPAPALPTAPAPPTAGPSGKGKQRQAAAAVAAQQPQPQPSQQQQQQQQQQVAAPRSPWLFTPCQVFDLAMRSIACQLLPYSPIVNASLTPSTAAALECACRALALDRGYGSGWRLTRRAREERMPLIWAALVSYMRDTVSAAPWDTVAEHAVMLLAGNGKGPALRGGIAVEVACAIKAGFLGAYELMHRRHQRELRAAALGIIMVHPYRSSVWLLVHPSALLRLLAVAPTQAACSLVVTLRKATRPMASMSMEPAQLLSALCHFLHYSRPHLCRILHAELLAENAAAAAAAAAAAPPGPAAAGTAPAGSTATTATSSAGGSIGSGGSQPTAPAAWLPLLAPNVGYMLASWLPLIAASIPPSFKAGPEGWAPDAPRLAETTRLVHTVLQYITDIAAHVLYLQLGLVEAERPAAAPLPLPKARQMSPEAGGRSAAWLTYMVEAVHAMDVVTPLIACLPAPGDGDGGRQQQQQQQAGLPAELYAPLADALGVLVMTCEFNPMLLLLTGWQCFTEAMTITERHQASERMLQLRMPLLQRLLGPQGACRPALLGWLRASIPFALGKERYWDTTRPGMKELFSACTVEVLRHQAQRSNIDMGCVLGLLPSPPAARRLLPLCSNSECAEFAGGSEADVDLLKCGWCKTVAYCCQACQKAHWKAEHKQRCCGAKGAAAAKGS